MKNNVRAFPVASLSITPIPNCSRVYKQVGYKLFILQYFLFIYNVLRFLALIKFFFGVLF